MDAAFLERLVAAFRLEAEEHLQALSSGLLEMERVLSSGGSGEPIIYLTETIFREAHSLKGAARSVNFDDVETICQALEDVFSGWKSGDLPPHKNIGARFDPLHAALDAIQKILADSSQSPSSPSSLLNHAQIQEITRCIQAVNDNNASSDFSPISTPQSTSAPQSTSVIGNSPVNSPTNHSSPHKNGSAPHGSEVTDEQTKNQQDESDSAEPQEKLATQNSAPQTSTPKVLAPEALAPTSVAATTETVRIATDKLDALLLQAEEMVALKMVSGQRLSEVRDIDEQLSAWRKERNKARFNFHGKELSASDWQQMFEEQSTLLQALTGKIASLAKSSERDRHALNGLVDNLLEDTKKLLMQPFSTMLAIFPKLVRDLAREQNKEIEFVMRGGEVEIDKRILEAMKAPLTHLLRNSIDHGLERPDARRQNGKSERGNLRLVVSQSGGKVLIDISDDGQGIAIEAVKAAAIKHEVISGADAEKISDAEALQLIFKSSVSTSPTVTELSGRGLGMAIVREKVESLGGEISLETVPQKGTRFRIALPLTLATFRGLLVRAGDQTFVLPSLGIERVLRVREADVKSVKSHPTISVGDEVLAFTSLRGVLGIGGQSDNAVRTVVVLGAAGERVAFSVEEVLDEQEILLKSFEKPLVRVRHFAGATVLGSGKIAPVLNVADLLHSATRADGRSAVDQSSSHSFETSTLGDETATSQSPRQHTTQRRVLVADDSITSRMLIKNILEAAGYFVQTATDGQDALTELRAGQFDLLVSDVDMPRLNGFGLTEQVRADNKFTALPVVLVTGRETPEDREKGMDVGASAYVIKSSFDQSKLLEVIERLL